MEIKILDIDIKETMLRLESLGANKVYDDTRVVTYFKNSNDERAPFLKLTEEEKLKLSSQNDETREEIKLFVSRKQECVALLATLDYVPVSEVSARRVSYELGATDIDIDVFPGIPAFAEVDLGDDSELTIEQLLAEIGLSDNKCGEMSTPDIFKHYEKDYFEEFSI